MDYLKACLKAWLHRRPLLFWTTAASELLVPASRFDRADLKNAIYDHQTLAVMKRVLAADSICIDCGAHQGFFLDWMCRLAPAARHHAIEPLSHLHQSLARRFPSHSIHRCALGDTAIWKVANITLCAEAWRYSGARGQCWCLNVVPARAPPMA